LTLSGLDTSAEIAIADIGCGTGSSTIPLLTHTKANVTAVELLPDFLQALSEKLSTQGLRDRVKLVEADMASLPFNQEEFDAIWSEGAIYNIGFETGIKAWKQFLKPGGVLVVSEITWLREDVPEELAKHWEVEYPEIGTASEKIKVLENNSYSPVGYFTLDSKAWLENYYNPLQASFANFLERHNNSELAEEIVQAEEVEIALYKKYQDFISYGVYIAKRVSD
jgi:ubiquinone/menaquinone biosynthesis C-methylase UbiE